MKHRSLLDLCLLLLLMVFSHLLFLLTRTCGFIFLNMKSSMTLVMRVLLFGMRQMYHMQFGDQIAAGPALWRISHQRYCQCDLMFWTPFKYRVMVYLFYLYDLRHIIISWISCNFFRQSSTMAASMLMFSLLAQGILQIPLILSTNLFLPLEGLIVSVLICFPFPLIYQ